MGLLNGNTINQNDFISTSAGAGDSGKVPKLNASGVLDNTFLSESVTTFDSNGTWTKPSNGVGALIEAWGGGGSGASSNSHSGSGGGGGCYVARFVKLADLGATETVTVGNGGVAVANGNNGNAGGTSSFGSWVIAYGGGAGKICANDVNDWPVSGGAGGTPFAVGANGADNGSGIAGTAITDLRTTGLNIVGQDGVSGVYSGGGGGARDGSGNPGAYAGGNSVYGGGGGGGAHNNGTEGAGGISLYGGNGGQGQDDTTGTSGSVPGGGGGACSSGSHNSGAGGKGRVRITIF